MAVPLTLSSVPAQTPYVQYVATASQTVFPYPFEITQDSDLVCLINGVQQATDSGYTLSGQGATGGGNLTFTLGQTAGTIITLYRNITIARISQLSQNGTFFSSNFNNEYNRIYLIMQQLQQSLGGSAANSNLALTVPNSNNPAPTTLLTPAAYANKYLSFDANGNPQPAVLTSSGSITAELISPLLSVYTSTAITPDKVQTAAEIAASVIPTNYAYEPWRGEDIRRFGAVGDGATDNWEFLNTANSVGAALYIPPGTYLVNSNLTLNVPLFFDSSAILKPASGVTITINAPINAGNYQIFSTAAGGIIAGKLRSPVFPVEWWGAVGDGRKGSTGIVATISTALTDVNGVFTAADIGKSIFIVPPVFSQLPTFIGTIAAFVSAGAVTLSAAPTWASNASFTATCSTTTLNVSAVASGTLFAGQTILTGAAAGTVINYQLTGTTGGIGTYNVSISQTIASATAMTSSSSLSYYYGTDDTAAITAANGTVGTIPLSVSYAGDQGAAAQQLAFDGGAIYLMTAQAVIGNVGVTAAQWRGVGGSATIAFGISSSTTNCVDFATATTYVGASFAAIENMMFDGCFSGQDLVRVGGFQSPHIRNVIFQNSARDCFSITPPEGSFIQQADFQNLYLGPAGRHCIYVNPDTFANETDFLNLVLQYPSVRQSGGTAIYFDTTTGSLESWTITNYKASIGWKGDPNYGVLGSFVYVAASNGIFPQVGITFVNGYCEQGITSIPIGATVAPFCCVAGSYATIRVRGFYNSFWGVSITHADHDGASQFLVANGASQTLMTTQAFFAYAGEFTVNVSDGTNSDYYRFQAIGGKGATGNITNIGAKVTVGVSPTYTVTATNVANSFTVNFNNTGTVPLTINYSAITKDCGSAPQYMY